MQVLAIIPARSGSKGLKDKNIKLLCGKPLMAYTIEAAINSKCFDDIMVSTDSEEYAKIAKQYGANVPFFRSLKNSTDNASSWEVVLEVLQAYKKRGRNFTHICLLQPTSPIRDALDIRNAYQELIKKKAEAIVSICETEYSPSICNTLSQDKNMDGFISLESNKRRQEVDKFYRINGAIYFANTDFLKEDIFLYRKGCYGYMMEQSHSIDIDTELDFLIAKCIIEKGRTKLGNIDC